MREEFHGVKYPEGPYKQLYGWGTIYPNVWLPSLSELVGITGEQSTITGCYLSAMQGLNVSVNYWTDAQGGDQFAYFKQYNASGGGERIWNACNQQVSWLRSSVFAYPDRATVFSGTDGISHIGVTASFTVHPAAGYRLTHNNACRP